MHSRAFLLLKRDLINLQRIPIEGITGGPSREDTIYHWKARIEGLKGTVWENGVFQISLTFSDDYNVLPPSVQFMTIPYHPNVHPKTGVPSFGLLNEEWNESHSVSSLLLSLQVLMSNPELDSGCILNHEAEKCYKDTPHTYNQMAFDCVTASQRIEAGLTPYSSKRTISCPNSQPSLVTKSSSQEQQRQFKKIPFDDYHVMWQGLATSVPVYNPNNKFMQLLDRDDYLRQVHFETEYHKNLDLQKRTEEYINFNTCMIVILYRLLFQASEVKVWHIEKE
jgi:ubiquitin-conjugating enzyme E2 U